MNCPSCGNKNGLDAKFCRDCGASLSVFVVSDVGTAHDNLRRYHGLDALRGLAMLLGIVLHAALPYMPNVQEFWPIHGRSSHAISTIFEFIHVWRMPLFFILAGFFANLVISRKSWRSWWANRFLRIGLPIVIFSPLMSLTLPWIFQFGRTGEFIFFFSDDGQPFHLWFLWHLIMFAIFTVIFRLPYIWISKGLNADGMKPIGVILHKSKVIACGIIFRSRFPVAFIIICSILNMPFGGELIVNPIASGLYFVLGYSIFRNTSLLVFLKAHWGYYFLAGMVFFGLYMTINTVEPGLIKDIYKGDTEALWVKGGLLYLAYYLSKIICSVLFSYAFIGLAEKRFGSYNSRLRYISDGSYWMYLIHLPIVTLITFTMFNLHIPIELQFVIAIVVTTAICLGTYKYFVRFTPLGTLLNGEKTKTLF
jgi:glucan biosynthesis protein C